MTIALPRLSATQRTAVLQAIRTHADFDKDAHAPLHTMRKAEFLLLAHNLGIDYLALIDGALAATATDADADADSTTDDTMSDGMPSDATADPIAATVNAILDTYRPVLSDGMLTRLTDQVTPLAKAAHTTPKTIYVDRIVDRIVPANDKDANTPNDKNANINAHVISKKATDICALFGKRSNTKALQNLSVNAYNDPRTPSVDPSFVWDNNMIARFVRALNIGQGWWLAGPKGTGKTTMVQQLAARTGRRFVRVPFDRLTEPADLFGSFGIHDNATYFRNGVLVDAIQTPGCVILLDEPSKTRAGIHVALQTVMDLLKAVLKDDGGRTVDVAPGVTFWAADNTAGAGDETGVYQDAFEVDAAFHDRFLGVINVDYLGRDDEVSALVNRANIDVDTAKLMVNFTAITRDAVRTGALVEAIGFRRLVSWARLISHGEKSRDAFALAILNMARPDDREPLRGLEKAELKHQLIDDMFECNSIEVSDETETEQPIAQHTTRRDFEAA